MVTGRGRATGPLVCVLLSALIAGGLPGCAMFRKYDMAQIHGESAARPERNPVIFIHGFIGAKLHNRNTHESAWGKFMNAIRRCKTDDLRLPIDAQPITENRDNLVAYEIYESVAGVKFYGAILDALQTVGGYQMGDINNPKPGDTLFVYFYDWRRDNVESAAGLGRAIAQIKARLKNPELRFDIVAHSMGGLIADYYLKYGAEDVLDGQDHPVTYAGAENIGRLILVGTPLRGTMHAFRTLHAGISRTLSPDVLFTMPSIYQLLPTQAQGHFVDAQGKVIDVDLYDARTWERNAWSVFNPRLSAGRLRDAFGVEPSGSGGPDPGHERLVRFLQSALDRARAFHAALDREGGEGSPVPIHVFGSDCIPTLERAVLKEGPGGPLTLFNDESSRDRDSLERLMLAPGDGTVTADSLLALDTRPDEGVGAAAQTGKPFASTFFFCETHGFLSANKGFQDNLFYVLFYSSTRPGSIAARAIGR